MFLINALKKYRLILTHLVKNRVKRAQLFALGFRAHSSTSVAWTVSADGGGKGGRIVVGKDTRLDIGVVLRAYGGFISIGNHCSLNPYCVLHGKGGIRIGNGVRIASHTVIVASNHNFEDPAVFIHKQGISAAGIIIEDDVWIGAGARILDGVTVRRGSVVGAGAVVTHSTNVGAVVAGVPARQIRSRHPLESQRLRPHS